jgi:hypothetical protein
MAPAVGDALVCVSVINAIPRPAANLRQPVFRVVMALPLAVPWRRIGADTVKVGL